MEGSQTGIPHGPEQLITIHGINSWNVSWSGNSGRGQLTGLFRISPVSQFDFQHSPPAPPPPAPPHSHPEPLSIHPHGWSALSVDQASCYLEDKLEERSTHVQMTLVYPHSPCQYFYGPPMEGIFHVNLMRLQSEKIRG